MYQKQQKLFLLQRLLRIIAVPLPWRGILLVLAVTGGGGKATYSHIAPFTFTAASTNIAIADSPNETNASKILPVQLPSGSVRTELNLKDHPENLGKKIQITGTLGAYFSVPGLQNC